MAAKIAVCPAPMSRARREKEVRFFAWRLMPVLPPPGRDGLFNLIRSTPGTLRYEHQLIVAEGDYVIVLGRFSGTGRPVSWVAADIVRIENGRLAEHWDVLQDEATKEESKSGLPMFGDHFAA